MATDEPVHTANLETLIKQEPMLFRGGDDNNTQLTHSSLKTGFDALDQFLPTGGWPADALTEILVDQWGNGELSILLPLLIDLSQKPLPIVFVSPPHIPYAPALKSVGISLEQLIIIDNEHVDTNDVWWVAEKTLRHPECGAVLLWPKNHNPRHVRRLQLAANTANNPGFVFRCGRPVETPVPLRLKLTRLEDGLSIQILKSRFGWKQGNTMTLPTTSIL